MTPAMALRTNLDSQGEGEIAMIRIASEALRFSVTSTLLLITLVSIASGRSTGEAPKPL